MNAERLTSSETRKSGQDWCQTVHLTLQTSNYPQDSKWWNSFFSEIVVIWAPNQECYTFQHLHPGIPRPSVLATQSQSPITLSSSLSPFRPSLEFIWFNSSKTQEGLSGYISLPYIPWKSMRCLMIQPWSCLWLVQHEAIRSFLWMSFFFLLSFSSIKRQTYLRMRKKTLRITMVDRLQSMHC